MSNTLAQNPTVQTYSNATGVAKVFASGGTNPSLYIAEIFAESAAPTVTISDDRNAGNYAADALVQTTGNPGGGTAGIYSKQNTSTLTATITATLGAAAYGLLKVFELTGADTSAALDGSNTASGNNSQRAVALTPGTNNCSLFACGTAYAGDQTADSGWTETFALNGQISAYAYGEHIVDQGTAALVTPTFNDDTSNNWTMAIAAYKTAAGGGGDPEGRLVGGKLIRGGLLTGGVL